MLYLWCICVVFVLYLCWIFVLLDSSCLVQLMFASAFVHFCCICVVFVSYLLCICYVFVLYLCCISVVFVLYLCCAYVLLDSSCLVQLMFVPLSDSRLAADAQNWQVTSLFGQRGQGEKESLCAQYKLYVNSVKFSFIWEQEKYLSDEQTKENWESLSSPLSLFKHLQRLQTNNPITTKLGKKGNMFFLYHRDIYFLC